MGGGVGGVGGGGGEDSFSLVFENSIVLIKCTLYDTVFQRQVSICRGVVFSYSFSIYCAAYHGIWCSEKSALRGTRKSICDRADGAKYQRVWVNRGWSPLRERGQKGSGCSRG